jgi:UDP-glucose 4-epimerase
MSTWLVTGGAGYIGSHVVHALLSSGREVVVLDDFSTGLERRLVPDVPVLRLSVHDEAACRAAMASHGIDGVIHLAAKKAAGESVHMPLLYYRENVDGMISLLTAMRDAGVQRLVYSSSAAVYGTPDSNPITEDAALQPESPYGHTKVAGEWMARDAGIAYDWSWAALRYFNVAGSGSDVLGDSSVNNLVPMVFRAMTAGRRPQIFGDDYPTPDGTCIRDYIHVADLAEAHVAAAARIERGQQADVLNVGRGEGSSVREVMQMIADVTGVSIDPQVVQRRAGDPPASWAATERITDVLGWHAQRDLRDMITSAWSAWQEFPATQ